MDKVKKMKQEVDFHVSIEGGHEEIKRNKKSFNARKRELIEDGFLKCGEFANTHRFRKHVFMGEDREVSLVKGWMRKDSW